MFDRADHEDRRVAERGDSETDERRPVTAARTRAWLWYVAGIPAAAAVGYSAAAANRAGWAPVGVYSLAVGLALGIVLSGVAAMTNTTCRTRLMVGTVMMAVVTVAAEHAGLYHEFRQRWHEVRATTSEVAMFRPETPWSPAEYFARQLSPGRVALWCVDAALVVAGAVGTVATWRSCGARDSGCGTGAEATRVRETNDSHE